MNTIDITGRITQEGIAIGYQGQEYGIQYPDSVWAVVPTSLRTVLLDNLTFAATMHIPMADRGVGTLRYSTGRPLLEPYFFQNFLRDIPSCCEIDGTDPAEEVRRFLQIEYRFADGPVAVPEPREGKSSASVSNAPGPMACSGGPVGASSAIIPMSFGKDSLLTFALAEELGLMPHMVYVVESSFENERGHKERLGRQFAEQFGHTLHVLEHQTGALRDHRVLGAEPSEYGWGLQNTEYALLMLPYAIALGAEFILFGNEQTASMSYGGMVPGWTVYPCFDQSHVWTQHVDQMTRGLAGVRTGSLIEPLMDMMVQRILANRYPDYARYQMSCFAQGGGGIQSRWCQDCEVCAKMYLLCVGSGIDPGGVGFTASMLDLSHRHHFSLFGGESDLPYLRTDLARDEQLFAFHCARLLGNAEPLVREFERAGLADEARRREAELIERFCTIYEPISVPEDLRQPLLTLFRTEITAFLNRITRSGPERSTT